jgi:Cu/Zn superoxide dismutase
MRSNKTRKASAIACKIPMKPMKPQVSVAVFRQSDIVGEVVASVSGHNTVVHATFTALPPGKHGFHIHRAGDLRGEGCKGACAHWHKGPPCNHGGRPGGSHERHTGDLGNIEIRAATASASYTYVLTNVHPSELLGRAMIIHADEDDLGRGLHDDSKTTGHSGARIGCAVFGRA